MNRIVVHLPRTRIAHWLNALLVLLLLWSGFAMFGADRDFAWISRHLPAWMWHMLQAGISRRTTVHLHEWIGVPFALNGLLYLAHVVETKGWRRLATGLPRQYEALSYALEQRASYLGALGLAGFMVLSGAALWYRRELPWLVHALGGPHVILPLHIISASLLLLFALAHVVQVIRHGKSTLVAMTGAIEPTRARLPTQL